MNKLAVSADSDSDDFSVFPTAPTDFHLVIEVYDQLKQNRSKILPRKFKDESEDVFLLTTATNAVEMTTRLFRQNRTADRLLTSAWLSLAKEKATLAVLEGTTAEYNDLSEEDLRSIAKLSMEVDEVNQLGPLLAQKYGIVLILEEAFAAMKTDGCAFKLTNGTPVVALSLRYNRYDNFWFTLMHELAHVALHYDHLGIAIVDDLDEELHTEIEVEANRMASDSLVPRNVWRKLVLHQYSRDHLMQFANEAEVHPAIAAGMIRNSTRNFAIYSDLVNSIDIRARFWGT